MNTPSDVQQIIDGSGNTFQCEGCATGLQLQAWIMQTQSLLHGPISAEGT